MRVKEENVADAVLMVHQVGDENKEKWDSSFFLSVLMKEMSYIWTSTD